MCDAFELHESYDACELVRQLGALYDQQRKQGKDNAVIKQERRRISARLIRISARYEFRHLRTPSFCVVRES